MAGEICRVIKPNGLVLLFVSMGSDPLVTELKKLGFVEEKKNFVFRFPLPGFILTLRAKNPKPFDPPSDSYVLPFKPLPKQQFASVAPYFLFLISLCIHVVGDYLIYQYWDVIDIPKSLPPEGLNRLGSGFLTGNQGKISFIIQC
jgi:hypothetical protein